MHENQATTPRIVRSDHYRRIRPLFLRRHGPLTPRSILDGAPCACSLGSALRLAGSPDQAGQLPGTAYNLSLHCAQLAGHAGSSSLRRRGRPQRELTDGRRTSARPVPRLHRTACNTGPPARFPLGALSAYTCSYCLFTKPHRWSGIPSPLAAWACRAGRSAGRIPGTRWPRRRHRLPGSGGEANDISNRHP